MQHFNCAIEIPDTSLSHVKRIEYEIVVSQTSTNKTSTKSALDTVYTPKNVPNEPIN